MEPKILLKLIRDDISHLQGIVDDFSLESALTSDEVELAIVRTNGLLRQLELLQKLRANSDTPGINRVPGRETKHVSSDKFPTEKALKVIVADIKDDLKNEVQAVIPERIVEVDPVLPVNKTSENTEKVIIPEIRDLGEGVAANTPDQEFKNQSEESSESQQMVNDLLIQGKSESGYQIIPIKSIWDGIGINDRILFVRELFDNDSSKFESAVTVLDQAANIQQAVNYLKINYKWRKTEASKNFLILVKRRFTN